MLRCLFAFIYRNELSYYLWMHVRSYDVPSLTCQRVP